MLTAWKFIVLSRYFHGPLQQGWKFSVTYEFILTVEDRGKLYPTGPLYIYIYRTKPEFAQEAAAETEPKTWLDSTVLCLGARQSPFNGVIPTLCLIRLSLIPLLFLQPQLAQLAGAQC